MTNHSFGCHINPGLRNGEPTTVSFAVKPRRARPAPVLPEANLWFDGGRVPHPPSGRAHRLFFSSGRRTYLRQFSIALASSSFLSFQPETATAEPLTILPQTPIQDCRGGQAKLYDECHAQRPIFDKALRLAKTQNKTLLVSYGAEWCIWCHVFHAYITGEHGTFTHTFADPSDQQRSTATIHEKAKRDPSKQAAELARFVADQFVVVHIDAQYAKDGFQVLERAGADGAYRDYLPFIFSVKPDGTFAAALNPDRVETRRDIRDWFRGYDRKKLTAELLRLEEGARE